MKNISKLAITFLLISLFVTTLGIAYLVYNYNLNVFTNVLFYILSLIEIGLVLTLIFVFGNHKNSQYVKTLENRLSLWNTISYKVKGAGETVFNDYPIGVLVLDNGYNIKWSNKKAKDIVENHLQEKGLKSIANSKIYDFVLENENNEEKVVSSQIVLAKKIYSIEFIRDLRIIYLTDITEFVNINNKYRLRTLAVGYINVDNLEESLSELDVQTKADYKGRISGAIVKWAESFGAFIRAFSDSKFILMTDHEHLELMMENNFSILDDIKLLLKTTRAVHITLSIGIACDDLSVDKLSTEAEYQLELSLNRGGDQASVKFGNKVSFFGAKTEPTRKESKVELRYYYHKLEKIMKSSSTIFCMGHKYQDADSFGSVIAVYNLAVALGKKAYIIFDENMIDATVKKVYDDVKKYHQTLHKVFITPNKAVELANSKSLLMIVDCQSENQIFLSSKQLMAFKNIGVIDHHRKNDQGTIEDTAFYYSEPAASSCVEVIFTLLEYSEFELSISENEATWMLLGMVVDTNNFVYRTSDITFEIAAKLTKLQANMGKVKEYLKEKREEKLLRSTFIADVESYRGNVAIAIQSDNTELEAPTLAKVSDDLLSIEGFILAVTVGYTKGGDIRLSARSLGKVNCQVLMEKLGGGGHMTAAATVIKESTMAEVKERLKNAIDQVLKNEEIGKVILTQDVKGKGKKGEILSFEPDQIKSLLKNNQAIEANTENIRLLEQEKQEEKEALELQLREYYAKKEKIESTIFKIEIGLDKDGHMLDVVTPKTIADALSVELKEKIDKRKVTLDCVISVFGTYEAQLQLSKDIYATVTLQIIEKTSK